MVWNTKRDRKISDAGLEHLKQFEGLSLSVYNDVAGYPTIGYGHLIKAGEQFDTITEQQAENLLREDVGFAESAVNQYVTVPLSQTQFDALVSFVFNVGAGAFRESTLLRKLNDGDYVSATVELDRWTKAGGQHHAGLANRRNAEQELFWA